MKRRLLGAAYARLSDALARERSVAPTEVAALVYSVLSHDRPGALRWLAAGAFVHRARVYYRARRALSIATHYDLPSAFYRLFLDTEYAAYSCAVFADDAWTLERAQRRKFEMLAAKLAAKPGDHVLEIGAGWGSFQKYARDTGIAATGITLSREQMAECRQRGFLVDLGDAADTVPGPVDRILTVGMMEHCKDQRAAILRNCFEALRPGGRMVVQEMCAGTEPGNPAAAVLVAEELFPGDALGTYISIQKEARRAGFRVQHLEGLGRHYERTSLEWATRLAHRFAEAEALVGYRTAMLHLLSQAGFAWYFGAGALDLLQYVLVKP